MSQRYFSYVPRAIRLFAVIAVLLLHPAEGFAQGALTLTTEPVAAGCGLANGTIYATGMGGYPPYTYDLEGTINATGVFPNLGAGQYTVTITDQLGNSTSNFVTVNSSCLVVGINTVAATCGDANGTATVSVTGGTGPYEYADGGGYQAANVFNNLAEGTYTITVIDQAGNVWTQAADVGNISGPTVSTSLGPASCLNDDGTITVTTSGGTAPFTYAINGGAYGTDDQFTGVASGTQTISVKDANGCVTPATATVPLTDNLTLTVGAGATICQGTTTSAVSANSNAASFFWMPAAGLNNTALANPVADPQTTTAYTVTAVLGLCNTTGSETITVLPAPVASTGASDTICSGKSAQLEGSGGVQYLWSPATYLSDPTSADPTVQQPAGSVTYSLTVTGANGCASVQPATEAIVVTPPPVVFAGDDTAVLLGQPVPLDAIDVNNSGFTAYQWSPTSGLSNAAIQDPVAQITGNIIYTVLATTADGCSGTASITIVVAGNSNIVVPNAFTPNGDGRNDVVRVDAIGIRDFKYFTIFNRWGQEVFTTNNQGAGWDGTRGGQEQPAGVYVWMAAGVDDSGQLIERKGTVILIR